MLIGPRNTFPISAPKDVQNRTLIVFSAGCTYRRILEEWLGAGATLPDRVLELGSYHAIVACVAAGSGIAIMPRSVLDVVKAHDEVAVFPLPPTVARTTTCLVWRRGHSSVALAALRGELAAPEGDDAASAPVEAAA